MKILSVEGVEKQLRRLRGNISAVARAFGVNRSAVQQYIHNHADPLEQVLKDSRETMLDEGEHSLDKAVRRGEGWAVQFLLKTVGRSRGYTERQELSTPELDAIIRLALGNLATKGQTQAPGTDSPVAGDGSGESPGADSV